MNVLPPNNSFNRSSEFDSSDCLIVYIDGPGDTTVRPPSPLIRQLGMELREKLARQKALADRPTMPENPQSSDAS